MKEVELVVLLNGNFVVIKIDESEKDKLHNLLLACRRESLTDPTHYIRWGDFVILSKAIVGWYFRNSFKTAAEKLLNLVEKELPAGEDWKSEE